MSHLSRARALAGTAGFLLLSFTPAAAAAQEPAGAQSFCVSGNAARCFGFAITDEATGFDVWLRNLSPFQDDMTSPFDLDGFSIRRENARTADGQRTELGLGFSNLRIRSTGSAHFEFGGWSENLFNVAPFPPKTEYFYDVFGGYGVLGCGLPSAFAMRSSGYVGVTCADRGYDGWIRIPLDAVIRSEVGDGRRATAADVAVQVEGCTTHLGSASGLAGGYPGAASCGASLFPSTTAPEPAVAWLVGAGAAGVLGATRVRRRAHG
jgi:hypothetical protein